MLLTQETVWKDLAALTHRVEALLPRPLERYWNEECRKNMFHAITPDPLPESVTICTDDRPPTSPYEQKLVATRSITPEPTKIEPSMMIAASTTPLMITYESSRPMNQASMPMLLIPTQTPDAIALAS